MSSPTSGNQNKSSTETNDTSAPQDELSFLSSALGFSVVHQETLENKAKDEINEKIAEANAIKEAKEKAKLEALEKKKAKSSKKNKDKPEGNEEINIIDDIEPDLPSIAENILVPNTLPESEKPLEDELGIFSDISNDPLPREEPHKLTAVNSEPRSSPQSKEDCSEKEVEDEDSEYLPEDNISKNKKPRKKAVISDSEYEETSSSEKEEEVSSSSKTQIQVIDDLEPAIYRARVDAWLKTRASHRTTPIEGHEKDAPHPLYKDSILEGGAKVPGEIFKDLMDYQKIGVEWFWKLFQWKQGGILADEMGLGKTIQAITFLATLYYSKKLTQPSLVVCPATLSQQWVQELHRWWPPFRVINLHIAKLEKLGLGDPSRRRTSKKGRKYAQVSKLIRPFFKRGNIFITSYEGFMSYGPRFAREDWGCVILDEGHKISNPDTMISKATKLLETPYRYILSGTPIQNKLKELWAIYDFIRPGLLGTQEEFDKRIARSIELTGSKGKDIYEKQLAFACARNLRSVIKNNLLRRLKLDVALELPKKTEQVLYCKLHPYQRHTYIRYLDSQECQSILNDKLNHMTGITALRKICNHPDLVYYSNNSRTTCTDYGHYDVSGKTRVLDGLLKLWKTKNHRVLIFCQTIQTQDILRGMDFFKENKYLFMNGKTNVAHRMELVDRFNTDPSIFVFLLTTRTGGQGLNLTGADRVVIFDPDWNPSADLQALSRAWRLGQSKEVSIFRLLTSGTIEERVHHLQLYKQLLSDRILKDPQQKLLFRNHNNDLFAYPPEDTDTNSESKAEAGTKPSISSIEEAERVLSIAETFAPEPIEEDGNVDKPDANQQSMLDMIGVGNESVNELEKQQTSPKDSVAQKLDRVAADKFFGLNTSIQLNGNNKRLPNLPDAAFTRKSKRPLPSSGVSSKCNLEKMQKSNNSPSQWNIEKLQRTNGTSSPHNTEKLQNPRLGMTSTSINSINSTQNNKFNLPLNQAGYIKNVVENPFSSISRPSRPSSFGLRESPQISSQQTLLPFRPLNNRPTLAPQPTHSPRPTHLLRPTHSPRPSHSPRPTHPPRPTNTGNQLSSWEALMSRQKPSGFTNNRPPQAPNLGNLPVRPPFNRPGNTSHPSPFTNRSAPSPLRPGTLSQANNRNIPSSLGSRPPYFRPRPASSSNSLLKRFNFKK